MKCDLHSSRDGFHCSGQGKYRRRSQYHLVKTISLYENKRNRNYALLKTVFQMILINQLPPNREVAGFKSTAMFSNCPIGDHQFGNQPIAKARFTNVQACHTVPNCKM